jgi:hypothetical protein
LLLLATSQPFLGAGGILCEMKGKDCPANAALGVPCCCDTGCDCGASKERTPPPTQPAGHDNLRVDFALVEIPTVTPAAGEPELFEPVRIAAELATAHVLPRVAVTCIRLN